MGSSGAVSSVSAATVGTSSARAKRTSGKETSSVRPRGRWEREIDGRRSNTNPAGACMAPTNAAAPVSGAWTPHVHWGSPGSGTRQIGSPRKGSRWRTHGSRGGGGFGRSSCWRTTSRSLARSSSVRARPSAGGDGAARVSSVRPRATACARIRRTTHERLIPSRSESAFSPSSSAPGSRIRSTSPRSPFRVRRSFSSFGTRGSFAGALSLRVFLLAMAYTVGQSARRGQPQSTRRDIFVVVAKERTMRQRMGTRPYRNGIRPSGSTPEVRPEPDDGCASPKDLQV